MSGRNTRKIYLGIQWDAVSWDDVPLWCDFLFERLGKAPVCWNIPALPQDGRARGRAAFVRALLHRIEDAGDAVALMGFAGACHPLLSIDELEKELSWGLKNPWAAGLTDVFGVRPSILAPRMPDFQRPKAVAAYRRHGFQRIGIASDEAFHLRRHPSGVEVFPFFRVPAAAQRASRRSLPPRGDLFLMLDLTGLSSQGPLEALFPEMIDPLLPFATVAFPGPAEASVGRAPLPMAGPRFDCAMFPPTLMRDRLEAIAPLSRKRRKKAEEYQKALSALSPVFQLNREPAGASAETMQARFPVAHMLGEVTLAGSDFDVKLSGGRFCGIMQRGEPLLPPRPALSFLRVAGRTHSFRTKSSFSFESDGGTGLREELAMDGAVGQGATLDIEYTFRDDSPLLTIAADILYPPLAEDAILEECVPFSIALAELRAGTAAIEASAPDGSLAAHTLSDRDGWTAVPGASHAVALRGGSRLVLRAAPEEARRWWLPFFRVSRAFGRRPILEVNPFGSSAPVPGRWVSGRRQSFALLLGIEGP